MQHKFMNREGFLPFCARCGVRPEMVTSSMGKRAGPGWGSYLVKDRQDRPAK